MRFQLRYLWLLALFLLAQAEERSTVQIISDDVNDGRVKTTVCKTAIFSLCVQPGITLRLNETISCLFDQLDWLDTDGTCYMYLNSVVANMVEQCVIDQSTICGNVSSATAVLTCLATHYYAVSQPCSDSISLFLDNLIPCVAEANTYCPTEKDPVKIMHCLNDTVVHNADAFSPACLDMVHKYNIVSPSITNNNGNDDAGNGGQWEEWSEDHDDDGGDDGSTSDTDNNAKSGSKKKRNKVETDDAKTPFEDTEPETFAEESYFTVVGALFVLVALLILFRCIRGCFVGSLVDVRTASMVRSVDPDAIDTKGSYVRASTGEDDPAEDVLL